MAYLITNTSVICVPVRFWTGTALSTAKKLLTVRFSNKHKYTENVLILLKIRVFVCCLFIWFSNEVEIDALHELILKDENK